MPNYDGQEFEVVWSGRDELLPPRDTKQVPEAAISDDINKGIYRIPTNQLEQLELEFGAANGLAPEGE